MDTKAAILIVVVLLAVTSASPLRGSNRMACKQQCMETFHTCISPCRKSPMHMPQNCEGRACHEAMGLCLRSVCHLKWHSGV
ncbi:hypothetical protein DPMN_082547 [Dreissena polymorpha]|uniref:Uncharacterized protein n=1 Tax=Dreissena polymorpha TaxID=45954 RepID=A0A9D4BIX9_DREPO|nr:hypothetical protein DPMN_082547 [Dreissena polymorpha]